MLATWPGTGRAQAIAMTPLRARFAFDWSEQFRLSLDPETAQRMHQESLAATDPPNARILQHVRAEVLLDESDRRRPPHGAGPAVSVAFRSAKVSWSVAFCSGKVSFSVVFRSVKGDKGASGHQCDALEAVALPWLEGP